MFWGGGWGWGGSFGGVHGGGSGVGVACDDCGTGAFKCGLRSVVLVQDKPSVFSPPQVEHHVGDRLHCQRHFGVALAQQLGV
jgi:hypothetical protein